MNSDEFSLYTSVMSIIYGQIKLDRLFNSAPVSVVNIFSTSTFTITRRNKVTDLFCTRDLWRLLTLLEKETNFYSNLEDRCRGMLLGIRHFLEHEYNKFIERTIKRAQICDNQWCTNKNDSKIEIFLKVFRRNKTELENKFYSSFIFWVEMFYYLRSGKKPKEKYWTHTNNNITDDLENWIKDWLWNDKALPPNIKSKIPSIITLLLDHASTPLNLCIQYKLAVLLILFGDETTQSLFIRKYPKFFSTIEDLLWFKLIGGKNYKNNHSYKIKSLLLINMKKRKSVHKSTIYSSDIKEHICKIRLLFMCLEIHDALTYSCSIRDVHLGIITLQLVHGLCMDGVVDIENNKVLKNKISIFCNTTHFFPVYENLVINYW
eukprot:gnl/TRDRNA2_/TRDRNA2_178010_c3_seq2.p1 gnl/TRDRNA2_/TRDRNA2_178010_c3~~gnl/TRDRNA2_/TRDRNA2_178010_c3_seq2.p1  ORF type:complete len:376 (+),score=-36.54 gnl/TRDRNA2_/TRDRNA2_178010_c3_seq2:213-1340(+)